MAELSFARKYRPTTISGYVGNTKLKEQVFATLKKSRPQVWLFQGNSGCGKTTFARLLAKEYLCEHRDAENGACCECEMCQMIDEYILTGKTDGLMNIEEVDVTSAGDKKGIEAVIERMLMPHFDSNSWNVYIFDEVHKATDTAQNRMLKMFEEPPANTLMVLCTTEPDKLIETLRNRCNQKMEVKKPSVSELSKLLQMICQREDADYDQRGLNFICNRAECTIRESLQELEACVTQKGSAKYDDVVDLFEEVSDAQIEKFYRLLIKHKDIHGYVSLIDDIRKGVGCETFVRGAVDFLKRGIYIINSITVDGVTPGELTIYRDLFMDFSVEQLSCLMVEISKLISDKSNLEYRLLTLGYTGYMTSAAPVQIQSQVGAVSSGIPFSQTELVGEQNQASHRREQRRQAAIRSGTAQLEEMSEETSFDELQDLLHGSTVKMGES